MDPVRDAELYRGLEDKLGTTVASALMERLPPPPVDRLATKDDVDAVRSELGAFRTQVEEQFEKVDQRFEKVDQRFEKVDQRFEKVDERFDRVDQRFNAIDIRFEKLEGQMAKMQAEFLAAMRGEMVDAIHTQGRQLAWTLFGSLMSLSALAYLFGTFAS